MTLAAIPAKDWAEALATYRSAVLKSTRAELAVLHAYAEEMLALPDGPLSLTIAISEMSVIPSVVFDAISCIAFGTQRVIAPSATFDVASAAVDEVEIELWDYEAAHMLGSGTFSIMPLLRGEQKSMDEALDIAMPGEPSMGSLRVLVKATKLADDFKAAVDGSRRQSREEGPRVD